ncbi:hypothetical protein D1AOALGA4SA_5138 [Olavius algarvensis Delta 1 endosymbiont]|nr:hypothetical protein D1AOALGA4SA_5138 [Olavius algarvensis Delta 1 endosymbiont]
MVFYPFYKTRQIDLSGRSRRRSLKLFFNFSHFSDYLLKSNHVCARLMS